MMAVIAQGISVDPEIMGGEPCLVGHRWPTQTARNYAKAGLSVAAMQREFPWLTHTHIANALAWEFRPAKERAEIVRANIIAQKATP